MACNLFPHAYERLVNEDIEWLKANAPDSLERDHILAVLNFSMREYRVRGYDEAMHKTGPHWIPNKVATQSTAAIKQPYTLAEIQAKIASGDYSAELLLQHAILLLLASSKAADTQYDAPSAAPQAPAPAAQQHPDDAAVDHFAAAMKAKLAAARAKGRSGWDDPAQCTADDLAIDLRKHVNKGDPVDVANFAMFLHARGESTKLRPLSGDLIDASTIENGGAVVFVSREGDHSAPTLLLGEINHRELNAEVTRVNYLAGEIFLRVTGGREVPQDLAAGAEVDILYQAAQDGEQQGSAA